MSAYLPSWTRSVFRLLFHLLDGRRSLLGCMDFRKWFVIRLDQGQTVPKNPLYDSVTDFAFNEILTVGGYFTVSVISIGPECLRRDVDDDDGGGGGGGGGGWIRLFSWLMVQWLVAFGMGWGLYGEFFFESFPFLLLSYKSFIIYFRSFAILDRDIYSRVKGR